MFSRIHWEATRGVYSGNVIIGDIETAEWYNILSIIKKSTVGIKLIPIKNYIEEKIDDCKKYSEIERQRRYTENNWM